MKKTIQLLTLPFLAMEAGAYDSNVIQNYWKVLQRKVNDYFISRSSRTINTPAIFPYILTEANMTSSQFDLNEIKIDWQARLASGKKGLVATVRWMPPLQMDDVDEGNGLPCDNSDFIEAGYQDYAYQINRKKTSKKIKVDNAVVRCIKEDKEEYHADSLANLFRATVSSLARDVEATIYDVGNGYIGQFPDRFSGTVDTSPGKPINLFRDPAVVYNTLNPVEESNMRADLRAAQIPEWVIFGGTRAQAYADLKNISGMNTTTGYDPSMLEGFNTSGFFFDDYIQDGVKNTGRATEPENPMLVYRPGALQFIPAVRNVGSYALNSDHHIRTTMIDPIFGLEWDLFMSQEVCGEELVWYAYFQLHWTVIGYPNCPWTDDPKRQGVTDLLLYDVQCGDTPVCNLPIDNQEAKITSEYVDDNCDIDETCDGGCSVTLNAAFLANGDYQIIAFPNPSLGADTLVSGDYAWEVNGGGVATPTPPNILVLAAGAYSDGDTVEVTITDSTGCIATADLVVQIPEIAVEVVDNTSAPLTDAGLATIANAVQGAATPVVNNVTNIGGIDPLTITGVNVTGGLDAGYIAPTGFPKSAPYSFSFDWDQTSTGLKTVSIEIFTNDPNTANFNYDVTITLT